MCGRTSLYIAQPDLESRFDADLASGVEYRPRYNIAPSENLEVITSEDTNTIDQYHWGLLPFWADEPGDGLINARSETAHEKNAFQASWDSRPCLVLSSGFYEWRETNGGPKQPYRIFREGAGAFAIAGLWRKWSGEEQTIPSVTILTTEPNELMEPIHDRMPVVLPEDEEETWFTTGHDERADMCRPYPDNDLTAYEISTRVDDPANDDAQVIQPSDSKQSGLDEFSA